MPSAHEDVDTGHLSGMNIKLGHDGWRMPGASLPGQVFAEELARPSVPLPGGALHAFPVCFTFNHQ
jgi:hypothetical protein